MGVYAGPEINESGLVLALDAGNTKSYPGSGTTWTDLSGNSNTGTLTNGPTYSSANGGSIGFDGVDDRIECGTFSLQYLTISTWVYKTSSATNQGICRKDFIWAVAQYNGTLQVAPGTSWTFYDTGYTIPLNTWVNIVYTYSGTGAAGSQTVYVNGSSIYNTSAGSGPISSNSNPVRIGFDDNGWYWGGRISNTQIYNRALSAAEVSQNYNALAPRFVVPSIVTSGLVLNLDAGNTASYSGSGSTWTDISGNGNNLTLTNSPTWNSPGYFSTGSTGYFTGAGSASIPTGNSPYTMICWVRVTGSWADLRGIISIGGFGTNNQSNALRTSTSLGNFAHYWWFNDLTITNNNAGLSVGTWFMVTAQFDGTNRRVWANTTNVGSDTPTSHNVTSTTIQVAKTFSTEYLQGDIATAQIYNRALSATEIQQNFNALRGRYRI